MLQPNTPPYTSSGPYPGRNPYRQRPRPSAARDCLACLPWLALPILLLVLFFGGAWLLVQSLQSNASFLSFFNSNHDTLLVILYIVVFAILVVAFLAAGAWRSGLVKPLAGVAVAMIWILIVGVLLFNFISPHVGLTRTGFSTTSLTIVHGNTVTFDNPSDEVTQILCLGRDQHCTTDPKAFSALPPLAQGLVLHAGQSVSITFDNWGDYHITSKTTPHMNLIISVTGPHSCKGSPTSHCTDFPSYGTESRKNSIAQLLQL